MKCKTMYFTKPQSTACSQTQSGSQVGKMKSVPHRSIAQLPRIAKSYHHTAAGAEKKVHATLEYKKWGIFLFEQATLQKSLTSHME